jgi:hypothetical protein
VEGISGIEYLMAYVIEYFEGTKKIGSTPCADSIDAAIRAAEDGLKRHHADFYRIMDDSSGAEVESGRRDAPRA